MNKFSKEEILNAQAQRQMEDGGAGAEATAVTAVSCSLERLVRPRGEQDKPTISNKQPLGWLMVVIGFCLFISFVSYLPGHQVSIGEYAIGQILIWGALIIPGGFMITGKV